VIHFEQWENDEIEVKLILKGGGCETRTSSIRCPWSSIIWAKRGAIWRASASASCMRCGRRKGKAARRAPWEYASEAIARTAICWRKPAISDADDTNPNPELAKLEAEIMEEANKIGIGAMGFGGKVVADRDARSARPTGCLRASLWRPPTNAGRFGGWREARRIQRRDHEMAVSRSGAAG